MIPLVNESGAVEIRSMAEFERVFGPRPNLWPKPIATRVVRERTLRWSAWVMEPGGLWFHVGRTLTRRGAQRLLAHFVA